MNKPNYVYDKLGSIWYIFKMMYIGDASYGSKLPEPYFNEQDAKIETYRLNGWELNN